MSVMDADLFDLGVGAFSFDDLSVHIAFSDVHTVHLSRLDT